VTINLTKNEKIALGIGGVAVVGLIGLHLYNQSRFSQTVTDDGLTVKQTGPDTIDISYTNTNSLSSANIPFFQIRIIGPGLPPYVYQTTEPYSSTPTSPPVGTWNVSNNSVVWTGVNLASLGGGNGTYNIYAEKGAWVTSASGGSGMADLGKTSLSITINTVKNVSWWERI